MARKVLRISRNAQEEDTFRAETICGYSALRLGFKAAMGP